MKKKRVMIAILLSLSLVLSTTGVSMGAGGLPFGADAKMEETVSAEAAAMVKDSDYAKDQVIVVFKDKVSDSAINTIVEKKDAEVIKISDSMDAEKMVACEIDKKDTVEEAITRLSQDPKVLYAQPNYRYSVDAEGPDPYNNDDPMNQWYLKSINARKAWDTMRDRGSLERIKVAVIDTGVDPKHLDLKKNLGEDLWRTDTKGGFVPLTYDQVGHGTHVSGIIGGTYNNKLGISGVAAGSGNNAVELMVFDATSIYWDDVYLDTFNIVDALMEAEDLGAKVINMSFGGFGRDRVLEEATEYVYQEGVVLVAAAGNEDTDYEVSPSDFGEVISVCATTKENQRTYFSNYGIAKDISAPGANIKSTVPYNQYSNYYGTSMSSPMVAAAAAMVLSVNPALTPAQVKNILCATADDNINGKTGFNPYTGYGLLDIDEAVRAAATADDGIAVTDLAIKESRVRMNNLDNHMLETLLLPAGSLKEITWDVTTSAALSGSGDVVSVDDFGKVTALQPGTATVRATADGKSATCKITVNDTFLPEEIKITYPSSFVEIDAAAFDHPISGSKGIGIQIGDQGDYIDVEVLPWDAEDKSVYWKSGDKKVATVDENGYLEAKGVGETIIRAFTYNGIEEEIAVKVFPKVRNVKISDKPTSNKLKMGESFLFTAEVEPVEALYKEITWSTSNRSVATIDQTGQLTTVKPGRVFVVAKTNGGQVGSVRITIFTTDYKGAQYGLKAKVASATGAKLTWKSIPNADGYQIYRKAGGSYTLVKTVNGSTKAYTDKKLKTGTKYSYKIRAFYTKDGSNLYCGYSSVKSVTPKKSK